MNKKQKTLKKEVTFKGIGVHSGQAAIVTVKPAQADCGIILKHQNLSQELIKIGTIVPEMTMHATVLRKNKLFISTVEHLISAIIWFGIDNVIIEAQSSEIPILDGSASPLFRVLRILALLNKIPIFVF